MMVAAPKSVPGTVHWLLGAQVVAVPLIAAWLTRELSPPLAMWLVAAAVFASLKWLSYYRFVQRHHGPSHGAAAAYLLAWPGLDANTFFTRSPTARRRFEWWLAGGKLVLGAVIFWWLARQVFSRSSLLAGWVGMVGVILMLHFGSFNLLSLVWRRHGLSAVPLMQAPVAASSISDFWGHRWNRAFRDIANAELFRPLRKRIGPQRALLVTFLMSGIVHDLIISWPARAGYGLPTMYFALQGLGLLAERRWRMRRAGSMGRGWLGRVIAAIVIAGPACVLFHPPFVERVVLPMMRAAGAI